MSVHLPPALTILATPFEPILAEGFCRDFTQEKIGSDVSDRAGKMPEAHETQ
jgi:hypothetical protein